MGISIRVVMRRYSFLFLFSALTLGVSARDVTLTWEPVEDEIRGYRLFWGLATGQYTDSISVGVSTFYTVTDLSDQVKYYFAVKAIDYWGNESAFSNEAVTSGTEPPPAPQYYDLKSNYPNPFNAQTVLTFWLPEKAEITLSIFNSLGQKVRILESDSFLAGIHHSIWDGLDQQGQPLASGTYLGVLQSKNIRMCRPMVLMR